MYWEDRGPFLPADADGGGAPDPNRSLYRWHYHTNKRSVLLDIESASGRNAFDSLLSVADVLVDTYRPSEAAALGLDGPRLRQDYPALVHTTITGFGPDGPYMDYKATDIVALAMGGLRAITGYPEDPPNRLGGEQAYQIASLHAAVGTMLALISRHLDGVGRDVQVAMQDCVSMATLQTANFNNYTWNGIVQSRTGLNPPLGGQQRQWRPHFLYACKDGWIAYFTDAVPPLAWSNFVAWLSSYPGQRDEALEHLDFAIAEFEEMKMQPSLERALAAKAKADARPAPRPAYPDGLTRREVEVLRLVATGRTNRQIAEELVVSQATVAFHLTNIFNKTTSANRAEATAYAVRHELVS